MASELAIHGLAELMAEMEKMPGELLAAASAIVTEETTAAASELRANYPTTGTGNMAAGVHDRFARTATGFTGIVESAAPEAVWWEFGTQDRYTRQGWARGRAPQHKADGLIPIAGRHNRRMVQRVTELVERAGFTVTGDR